MPIIRGERSHRNEWIVAQHVGVLQNRQSHYKTFS